MRKTKEELLTMFPYWNTDRNDIVKTWYGDEPLHTVNDSFWQKYHDNISYSDAFQSWIYGQDTISEYRTKWGKIQIYNDDILTADIKLRYRGRFYSLTIFNNYMNSIDYVDLWVGITGKPGIECYGTGDYMERHKITSQWRKKIDHETVKKVLKTDPDMGYAVIKAIEYAKNKLL